MATKATYEVVWTTFFGTKEREPMDSEVEAMTFAEELKANGDRPHVWLVEGQSRRHIWSWSEGRID